MSPWNQRNRLWLEMSLVLLAMAAGIPGVPGCSSGKQEGVQVEAEAMSARGEMLHAPTLTDEQRQQREADLAAAQAAWQAEASEDNIIWLGRRYAYLGQYRQAIAVFSQGLDIYPDSARLLRHRGHRYITTRQNDRALDDLRRAAELVADRPDEVEPDGPRNQPNPRNDQRAQAGPRSTLNGNVFYHLGLAHYLQGRFALAAEAYDRCLDYCANDDMLVATLHWYYMTLRRLGRDAEAAALLEQISDNMDVLENHAYHKLLLMYRGTVTHAELLEGVQAGSLDAATIGYGVGNWLYCEGRADEAVEAWRGVISVRNNWPSFGWIASEADLARLGSEQG
jgi:tetratricopeptide (TPR) repeat protein